MSRHSSHYSVYLEALMDFTSPATAKQVHDRAIEKFGADTVKGGVESVRTSLRRYVKLGKALAVERGKYAVTSAGVDPILAMDAKTRRLEAENQRLRDLVRDLETENDALKDKLGSI